LLFRPTAIESLRFAAIAGDLPMPWLLKVILVGVLLGIFVCLAAAISWPPARFGFAIAGLFVFVWSMRDPALTFRRAFHFLIVLPAIPLGFSASAAVFGTEGQQSGMIKVIVDGSQALPPWLWFGLAALCVVGDAIAVKHGRASRQQLYQAETVDAKLIGDRKLVQVTFPFRPASTVRVSGAELRLRGIGTYSKGVKTWIGFGGTANEATQTNRQIVAADDSATVTVELTLDDTAFRRIQKRRDRLWGLLPIAGAVRLRGDSAIEPLPLRIS
jgi:hypothetical protein